jgi:hypothetical protein
MVEAERAANVRLGEVGGGIIRSVQERPWPALLLAAAAGYVMGGGFFSRVTRPFARAAMGALLVPGFRERFAGAIQPPPKDQPPPKEQPRSTDASHGRNA